MIRVLFLGDIVGRAARHEVIEQAPALRDEHKLDFLVVNCENAAGGFGVTPKICEALFDAGVDVLTTGNHVWDKPEIIPYIDTQPRLLRPLNMPEGTPGKGVVTHTNAAGKRLTVINVMTNLFMAANDPVFAALDGALVRQKLGRDADFILVDAHGEARHALAEHQGTRCRVRRHQARRACRVVRCARALHPKCKGHAATRDGVRRACGGVDTAAARPRSRRGSPGSAFARVDRRSGTTTACVRDDQAV